MSTELVQIGQDTASLAPVQTVGASIFSRNALFRLKPMKVSLDQLTTRAENSIPGKFRLEVTGEHFDKLRVVMLIDPRPGRTKYTEGADYGTSPECYSMDGVKPSENAQYPQSLRCATCRHNDWNKWKRNGRKQEDLPKCKERFTMYLVDQEGQIPYELDVRGNSIKPFRAQMQHIAALAQLYRAQHKVLPELFYFAFTISAKKEVKPSGVSYTMVFSDTLLMNEEQRKEFGALVAEFEALKQSQIAEREDADEEAALDAEFGEAASSEAETSFAPGDFQPKGEVAI